MRQRRTLTAAATALLLATLVTATLSCGAAQTQPRAQREVTFSRDVAPIFNRHCAECHRPGEAAPFSTLTYKDVRPWAKSIREKVVSRAMPPWHADAHVGRWANDRSLTQAEIDTVAAWVDGGAKEGSAKDLPPAPQFASGWTIGKPDVVFEMPAAYTLKPGGPDEIQYFEVDPGFTEDKYVQLAEARPNNREIVHHIIVFVRPPRKDGSRQLSREEVAARRKRWEQESIHFVEGTLVRTKPDAVVVDDGCTLPNGGGGSRRDGTGAEDEGLLLAGWAPGMNQLTLDAGTVKRVPAGSKLLFQVHYSSFLTPKTFTDRSSVGLVFAKQPPQKLVHTRGISNHYFRIPAGAENHRATACWTTKDDIRVLNFMPHMHLRGKAMKYEAFYPDGRREVLLNVPKFDFSWQTVYYAKEPLFIPKGTKILVTAWYDNSAQNKFNPDATKDVRWGDPTYEEMLIGWLDYTVEGETVKPAAAEGAGGTSK
jgi:mono/diheme cytochrome c family protein